MSWMSFSTKSKIGGGRGNKFIRGKTIDRHESYLKRKGNPKSYPGISKFHSKLRQ